MELSTVTDQITLEPESSGEVLVDVVNTEDVIDALDIALAGIAGASIRIDSATATLFPGARRRLALRIQLPAQVPAGRHRTAVEVRGVSTGSHRAVDLDVEVPPRPAMAAGAHPAVRRAVHRVDFPVTVTNRGNTHLHVRVRELDAPDEVRIDCRPPEFEVAPWSSAVCRARVTSSRHLVGGDTDHVVDLRVTARSTTPGRPLLEEEIGQEARVTFRQRPMLSPGILLAVTLITVTVLWVGAGFIGLQMFVRLVDPGTAPADAFFPAVTAPARPDVGITVAGQVVSAADGSPVAAVTVLACSQDGSSTAKRACTAKTATTSTISDGNGQFWLPGLFPGPYRLKVSGSGLTAGAAPVRWLEASCSLREAVSGPPVAVTVAVAYPTGAGARRRVKVAARLAVSPTASDPSASDPAASASPSPSAEPTGAPTTSQPAPPCPGPTAAPASAHPAASPGASPGVSPAASPAASPKAGRTVWRGRAAGVDAGDGTRTATVVVTGLPAPARYDLTIDAGAGLALTLREVHADAATAHPVITVTLQPSASPTPSPS